MDEQTISRTGTCYQNRLQRITQRGHKMNEFTEIKTLCNTFIKKADKFIAEQKTKNEQHKGQTK